MGQGQRTHGGQRAMRAWGKPQSEALTPGHKYRPLQVQRIVGGERLLPDHPRQEYRQFCSVAWAVESGRSRRVCATAAAFVSAEHDISAPGGRLLTSGRQLRDVVGMAAAVAACMHRSGRCTLHLPSCSLLRPGGQGSRSQPLASSGAAVVLRPAPRRRTVDGRHGSGQPSPRPVARQATL